MSRFFKFAAAAVAVVIILLAVVIVPHGSWDTAAIIGTLLLASAAAIPFAAPSLITGWGKSETGSLATIGPSAFILTGYFLLSAVTFVLAITGADRTGVWIAAIIAAGWLVVGILMTKGSVRYLDRNFPDNPGVVANRATIIAELSGLKSNCPEQFVGDLDRLSEKIRYAASDLPHTIPTENDAILALVRNDLSSSCRDNNIEDFRKALMTIQEIISNRDVRLGAARSKI